MRIPPGAEKHPGYGSWMIKSIAELRYLNKAGQGSYPFLVGECWDNELTIDDWLNAILKLHGESRNGLRFSAALPGQGIVRHLRGQSDEPSLSLAQPSTVMQDYPPRAVTFVDNHDTIRDDNNAILRDKLTVYSFILTHEGLPHCLLDGLVQPGPGAKPKRERHRSAGRGACEVRGRDDAGVVYI